MIVQPGPVAHGELPEDDLGVASQVRVVAAALYRQAGQIAVEGVGRGREHDISALHRAPNLCLLGEVHLEELQPKFICR